MRINTLFLFILSLALISGCGDKVKDFDLQDDPLRGTIGGEEWQYITGGGAYGITNNILTGKIFNIDTGDPCAIVNTIKRHVSLRIPAIRGNYTLSVDQVEVIFDQEGGSVKYTATGGFVEIVSVTSTEVLGYISANYDDNNSVQGSFFLTICN